MTEAHRDGGDAAVAAAADAARAASRRALAAVAIGLASALFFTTTYVLNRAAANAGGDWLWTAALRYLATLPLLLAVMPWQGGVASPWRAIRAHPAAWLRCSAIGFGLFYLALSFAAASGPSWLVAGTFQFTVVAGMLCAPFLYRDARRRVPPAAWAVAVAILAGVLMLQLSHAGGGDGAIGVAGWIAIGCVLLSAVAYPLGNRLLLLHLERTGETLNASQRVFGMTLASQPVWLVAAAVAFARSGPPPSSQLWLAAGVALGAGVVATILFFQATGMVRDDPAALGAVEAMQAAELLFAVALGMLLLGEAAPGALGWAGAALVVAGIVTFAHVAARTAAAAPRARAGDAARAARTDRGA